MIIKPCVGWSSPQRGQDLWREEETGMYLCMAAGRGGERASRDGGHEHSEEGSQLPEAKPLSGGWNLQCTRLSIVKSQLPAVVNENGEKYRCRDQIYSL